MTKTILKLYLVNLLNLMFVCFIIEFIFTIAFNYPNFNAEFTGVYIWFYTTIFLIYRICKYFKTNFGKFILYLIISFFIIIILRSYFTLFDFIEPRYYGFDGLLFDYRPDNINYGLKKFLFWQTGVSSEYHYNEFNYNLLVTFFTVPPVVIFECFVKAIFPNLYVILVIQFPIFFIKKGVLNWQ